MLSKIELSDNKRYIWDGELPINTEALENLIASYLSSNEFKRLTVYNDYYEGDNTAILNYSTDRTKRGVTPNNCIPTGYYKTIIDTMSGFMFSNVQYNTENQELLDVLDKNNSDVKTMTSGINALAYNKAIEIVYTVGDGINTPEIKFTTVDPRQMLLIYNDNIEPELICGIRITKSFNKDYDFNIDVIYSNLWQYLYMKDGKLTERKPERPLLFSECPVVVYNAEVLSIKSPFEILIPYIIALDFVITGNSDDIDKLTSAILVLSTAIEEATAKHLDELKIISEVEKDDIVKYVEKNNSPEFREYVSKLLINEIHKHSHVVDWYNPDSGISGDASAKALRTRLFDMSMFSKRIEKVWIEGLRKRINLISQINSKISTDEITDVEIILNREIPSEFIDLAPVVNTLQFISTESKLRMLGLDVAKEIELLNAEKKKNESEFENVLNEDVTEDDDI